MSRRDAEAQREVFWNRSPRFCARTSGLALWAQRLLRRRHECSLAAISGRKARQRSSSRVILSMASPDCHDCGVTRLQVYFVSCPRK